jgi:hypothetical protein
MNTTQVNTKQFYFDNEQRTVITSDAITIRDERAIHRDKPFPITLTLYKLVNSSCVLVVNETLEDHWVMNIFCDQSTAINFMNRYIHWHGIKF